MKINKFIDVIKRRRRVIKRRGKGSLSMYVLANCITLAEINRTNEENNIPHLSKINGTESWIELNDKIIHSTIIVLSRKQK
jgi:hypothetical protein